MDKYIGASDVPRAGFFLGVLIFMEMHRRICGNNFGEIPKPIKDDAFAQGGYCIDAPNELAAGAVESLQIEEDLWLPSQIICYRDGEYAETSIKN